MRPDGPRDPTAGPDEGPAPPFPLYLDGEVVKGFGRGSKELGIPTANIPLSGLSVGGHSDIKSGIYFGYASLLVPPSHPNSNSFSSTPKVYPMVMSIGWNPFYKNTVRSIEVWILEKFESDFYGAHMNLVVLGFVREEFDYVSKEALIEDIEEDGRVARRSLERGAYRKFEGDGFLRDFEGKSRVAS